MLWRLLGGGHLLPGYRCLVDIELPQARHDPLMLLLQLPDVCFAAANQEPGGTATLASPQFGCIVRPFRNS